MLFIYSFNEILCNIVEFIYLVTAASGMNYIPSWAVNAVIFYSYAAYLTSHLILVLLSFDRLIAICMPIM